MKEIIADLKYTEEKEGGILPNLSVMKQIESTLLDMAGKRVRIRITEYRPFYPFREVYRGKKDGS